MSTYYFISVNLAAISINLGTIQMDKKHASISCACALALIYKAKRSAVMQKTANKNSLTSHLFVANKHISTHSRFSQSHQSGYMSTTVSWMQP